MTSRIITLLFAAALGVVSIGCQPAEEPAPDTTLDVDLGEATTDPTVDSNTTTAPIETPEVESPGLVLPEDAPAEEPVDDAPAETEEPETN